MYTHISKYQVLIKGVVSGQFTVGDGLVPCNTDGSLRNREVKAERD
jgi:hypothetical protein